MKHISRILMGAVLALAGLCPTAASAQDAVTLPFNSDFSTTDGWTLSDMGESGRNVWVIGEDANTKNDGGACLFISPDGTKFAYTSPTYINAATSVAHAYFKVNVPTGKSLILTFRYFISGDGDERPNGYVEAGMYVGVFPAVPGVDIFALTDVGNYTQSYTETTSWYTTPALWRDAVITIDGTKYSGEQYVVFTWYNYENANKYGTFAAIDDVTIKVDDCPAPSALTVGEVTANSIAYSWTPADGIADLADYTYQIQKKAGTGDWEDVKPAPVQGATFYTLLNLDENTAYGFRIRSYRSESSYSAWVTAPVTTTPYLCPAPTDLTYETNASGDYVFSWTAEAEARYILEYKLKTATEWTATAELTAGTYTLPATELTPATDYEVRVHRVCATGALNYVNAEFRTPCGVETLPYTENFDTWDADGTLPCWTILDENGDGTKWKKETSKYTTHEQSAGCAAFGHAANSNDWLISPALQIEGVSGLRFWVKAQSTTWPETYTVWISETDTKPESFEVLIPLVTFSDADWKEIRTVLDEKYAGQKVYIGIQVTSNNQSGLYIDDFSVIPYPAPTIQVAVTTNSATLSLMPAAQTYSVRYRAAGTEAWTTLSDQTATVTISDLQSGTAYEVQAMAHYAGDHDSEWSDLMTFNTCVELPYIQDFSTIEAGQIPAGWNQTVGTAWKVVETDGRKSLQLPLTSSTSSSTIVSPIVSLEGVDFERLELLFTYKQKASSSYITASISTDGTTWTALEKLEAAYSNPVETKAVVPLKTYVDDMATSLMVRFEGKYNWASCTFDLYDIRIQERPRCLPPADLHIVAETQTAKSAEFAWTAPTEIVPTAYKFVYALNEADLETAAPEELAADALSKTLNGLTPNNTLYYVRMTTVCGEVGESAPFTFSFYTPYTCPKIEDLRLTKLTDVSAELAFTYAAEGVSYEAEYKEAAAENWTAYKQSVSPAGFALTGLKAETRYMARVRVVCADDDQSFWDTVTFKTPDALRALPFTEGFEGAFAEGAPAGWQYERLSGAAGVLQVEQVKSGFRYAGEAALRHPANTAGEALLVSPYLAFESDQDYRISFALRLEGSSEVKTDSISLWFNTAPTLNGARRLSVWKNDENAAGYQSDLVDGALGKWKSVLLENLTGLENGFLLLRIQGDAEQDYPFYIDELSVSRIYKTNLAVQSIFSIPPRANMGEEMISVVVANTGEEAFVGEVQLSYQVNDRPAVSETLTFTAENPLASQTPYTYTFAAKADLSAKGDYTIKVTLTSDGDPLLDDNMGEMKTTSYEAMALPFETDFSPASAGAAYIQTWNADHDDYEWILPPTQPQAMIYGRNSGHLDDYLYTPGLNLPAGKYEVRITYAARQETYRERLSVGAYTDFTDKEAALPILTDTTSATAQKTAEGLLEISEDGIYMLGIHAESDSSRGINVYSLSIKAKEEPVVKPVINLALFDTICDGETYRFGERELTEAGRYFDTIRAAEADTARELTLTVLLKPVPPVISRQDEGKTVTLVAETPEAQVQWYEADEMIFGAEEKRFTVTYDGVYHATAIGVCGESEASNKLEVKMPTANEGLEDAAALTLYPNPSADGRFILAVSPAYEGATLYVYSMDGRLRQRQTLHAGEQEIRLKAAETGVYMFRFVTADGRTYGLKATVR